MSLSLPWMRRDAPYMAIATAGLLGAIPDLRARWDDVALVLDTELTAEELAGRLAAAPLPEIDKIGWPAKPGQSLASALTACEDPLEGFAQLCEGVRGTVEERLLRALATDQARRSVDGPPARSRLLSGAKADLSPFRWRPAVDAEALAAELTAGPAFGGNDSGPCMGLAPEVHTFGGTVGRNASTIGAASPLLSLLVRHGLLALPPNGAPGSGPRAAGGPLLDGDRRLSWPVWTMWLGPTTLRAAFAWSEVHAPSPDAGLLASRGIAAVYRSSPVNLSDTVTVFRWGRRIA